MSIKVIVISLFLIPFFVNSQTQLENIDQELEKIYNKSQFPGFAKGIIKNDSVIFSKGYGYANIKEKKEFSAQTVLPIGSISRTFIVLALAKAIELNYFGIETPINDLLPFEIKNPNFPTDSIKIKHLFTHTSGILDNDKTFF